MRPARGGWSAVALAVGLLLPGTGRAARLGLNPIMGDGAAGRTVVLSGAGFLPGAILNVSFNGQAAIPATVTASATGFIAPVTIILQAMPYGPINVVLSNAARTYTFTGAYRVFPNLCVAPAMGDGRAGQTWETNGAIPVGGWSGMVFRIEGTGFAAGSVLAGNAITVAGVATSHPARVISATGGLISVTVIVTGNLARGLKDIAVPAGASATVFYGAYEVRRSLGLFPAAGPNAGGATATIFMEGFGFDNTTIPANSIQVGNATTQHPALVPVNGAWSGTVRLLGGPGAGSQNISTGQETFFNAWLSVKGADRKIGITPVTLDGVPNHAFQMQGLGNWTAGGSIGLDTTVITGQGVTTQPTTHAQIAIGANGRFGRQWVVIRGPYTNSKKGLRVFDPGGSKNDFDLLDVKPTFAICPVRSTGMAGWTITMTGLGLAANVTIAAATVAAQAAQAAGNTNSGGFGMTPPFLLILPPLPYGMASATLTDSAGTGMLLPAITRGMPTIGLSAVNGPGGAGETTDIQGTGFPAAGSIGAGTILFTGTAAASTVHPGITFSWTGAFGPTTITLPQLAAGPYDITAFSVFPAAYRVTPMIGLAKHRTPAGGGPGDTVSFSFSFTNIGVGDSAGGPFTLVDTVPPGLVYVAGSGASQVPGTTIDWRSWTCSCYVGAEPAPADVAAIRWQLPGALPVNASGVVSFQVVAP